MSIQTLIFPYQFILIWLIVETQMPHALLSPKIESSIIDLSGAPAHCFKSSQSQVGPTLLCLAARNAFRTPESWHVWLPTLTFWLLERSWIGTWIYIGKNLPTRFRVCSIINSTTSGPNPAKCRVLPRTRFPPAISVSLGLTLYKKNPQLQTPYAGGAIW